MSLKLPVKVLERIKRVAAIETLLVFSVAAFHFAVMSWGIRTNKFVADAELCQRCLKQSWFVAVFGVQSVCELEAVICLHTLHMDTAAGIPLGEPLKEVCRRIGRLLGIGREEAEPRELVDGGVLEQAQRWICDALARDDLDVDLNALSRGTAFARRVWARNSFSSLPEETYPYAALRETGFPGGVDTRASSADATALSCRVLDCGVAYHV